jgi:hypothetical protein
LVSSNSSYQSIYYYLYQIKALLIYFVRLCYWYQMNNSCCLFCSFTMPTLWKRSRYNVCSFHLVPSRNWTHDVLQERFQYAIRVVRRRKWKKNRQYNGQRKQCDVISNPTLMISKYKKNMNRANINNNNKTLDKQYTREYISIY